MSFYHRTSIASRCIKLSASSFKHRRRRLLETHRERRPAEGSMEAKPKGTRSTHDKYEKRWLYPEAKLRSNLTFHLWCVPIFLQQSCVRELRHGSLHSATGFLINAAFRINNFSSRLNFSYRFLVRNALNKKRLFKRFFFSEKPKINSKH